MWELIEGNAVEAEGCSFTLLFLAHLFVAPGRYHMLILHHNHRPPRDKLVKKGQQTELTHDARNQIKFIINHTDTWGRDDGRHETRVSAAVFFHGVILFDTLIPLNWRNIGMKTHLVIHPVSIYVFKMLASSAPLGQLTQHESQGFKKGETMTAAVMFIPHFLSN